MSNQPHPQQLPSNPSTSDPPAKAREQHGVGGVRSWFRFSAHRPKSKSADTQPTTSPLGNTNSIPEQDPYRPLQFGPPRIASLYVSPSERNLYLAAMAQLERAPPNLPLWSDPTPSIPPLAPQPPFQAQLPNHDGRPLSTANGHSKSDSQSLANRSMSPKLVTSPGVQSLAAGLSVRDEFRLNRVPPRSTRHALLSLVPPATLRFTGFPATAVIAADEALSEAWHQGVTNRSESRYDLQRRGEAQDGALWKVELEGRAWKRKGRQELDSIRLILAVLTALGVHGWTVEDSIQAGTSKKGCHNLLFSNSPDIFATPPAFFALSFPLPDRISIISAPSKNTPAIVSAVRNAITTSSAMHSRQGTGASTMSANASSAGSIKAVSWKGQRGVKLEGWVHPGVYRFWVGGMRRWVVGGVRKKVIDNLHPTLILGLINNISALHMNLVSSIPLLPISKGRDILIFSTLPSSGLSYRDGWKPDVSNHTSRSSSLVLVSPAASRPVTFDEPTARRHAVHMETNDVPPPRDGKGRDAVEVDSSGRRILPWTSVAEAHPTPNESSSHARHASGSVVNPSPQLVSNTPQRDPSVDSDRPLMSGSAKSSPKPRNLLLKKNSTRRKASKRSSSQSLQSVRGQQTHLPSAWQPISQPGRAGQETPSAQGGGGASTPEADRWSLIDIPAKVGTIGMSLHEQRQSADETQGSESSIYTDAHAQPATVRPEPGSGLDSAPVTQKNATDAMPERSGLGLPASASVPLAPPQDQMHQLGRPMQPISADMTHTDLTTPEGYGGLALRDNAPANRAQVVQNPTALASMHGSMGYAGQSVLSFASDRKRQPSGTGAGQGPVSGSGHSRGPSRSRLSSGRTVGQDTDHLAIPETRPELPTDRGPGGLGSLLRQASPKRQPLSLSEDPAPAANTQEVNSVTSPHVIPAAQSTLAPPAQATPTVLTPEATAPKPKGISKYFRKSPAPPAPHVQPSRSILLAQSARSLDADLPSPAKDSDVAVSEFGKSTSEYETAPSQAGSSIGGRGPGAVGSSRTKISLGKKS
ncbi:hypothetical protein BD324DRAFT_678147 [Kockovaella imperatae]|uniref:Uncharacterized protein n=1 Tax=Kockovaella imperatae TaxID=4999 RepID=A0A1Y1UTF2_9TREE|nr:hypothetical protein BD324DRAFT_678147 [Kockovaella imperatae]ORX40706.1 hypothetical protein BD324DRAFT_678147 [Kockovaella imperatae]